MLVWVPAYKGRGEVQVELSDKMVFEYTEIDVSSGALNEITLVIGAVTDCRFQVLFDIAAHNFTNGDYRACLASAHLSLERYREFFIRLVAVEHCLRSEVFDLYWNNMSSQSERQIGAYSTAFILKNKRQFSDISNKMYAYRNSVIHKGTLPSKKKTLEYCVRVMELIAEGLLAFETAALLEEKDKEFDRRNLSSIDVEISSNPILNFELLDINTWQKEFDERTQQKNFGKEISFPYSNGNVSFFDPSL